MIKQILLIAVVSTVVSILVTTIMTLVIEKIKLIIRK